MKKLVTTLVLFAGLVLGSLAIAPAAQADGVTCGGVSGTPCQPEPEPCGGLTGTPCPPPTCGLNAGPCPAPAPAPEECISEQTANDYRAQVIALTVKVDRLQRVADRRAAKIQHLRAVIRSLR